MINKYRILEFTSNLKKKLKIYSRIVAYLILCHPPPPCLNPMGLLNRLKCRVRCLK